MQAVRRFPSRAAGRARREAARAGTLLAGPAGMVQHIRSLPLLAGDDVAARFGDAEHWRRLNPQLTVAGGDPIDELEIPDVARRRIREEIVREGYFRLEETVPPAVASGLRLAVERLRALKLPPIFIFVYDEAWRLGARLAPALRALLGGPYAQVPGFWVWHLDARREAAGWPPHRDLGPHAVYPGGAPKIVTLWIPLSDATPENGCIYIVPRHLDTPGLSPADLQSIRALPARAGTVLGWAHDVLHWSGRASVRSQSDRVSFAIEFQRTDLDGPLLDGPPYTEPLLDARVPPPFEQRLSLIGQQVLVYSTRYQMPPRLLDVARRLVEAGDDAPRILADIAVWLRKQGQT
jgi:hypothetical protein